MTTRPPIEYANQPCASCGLVLRIVTSKVSTESWTPVLFEVVGLVLLLTTFWTIIGAVIGIALMIWGHSNTTQKRSTLICYDCGIRFPAPDGLHAPTVSKKERPLTLSLLVLFFFGALGVFGIIFGVYAIWPDAAPTAPPKVTPASIVAPAKPSPAMTETPTRDEKPEGAGESPFDVGDEDLFEKSIE